jgi:hypothetical protein
MWMHASRMHSRALRGVLAASLLVFLPTTVEAEDALRCFGGISPETAQQVFERLKAPLAEPACEFEGVTTQGPVLLATWKHDGTALPSARVQVRACMSPPPPGSGKFVVEIPEGLTAACPSAAQIASQIGSVLLQRAPRIEPTPETTPLYVGLQWLLAALVLLAGAVAVRELRRWPDPAWTGLLLGSFGLALTVRLTLPHVPTNWYSEVLPATGPPTWMRFGPGSFAWQALVRRVAPWNETTLYFSQSLLGSLAIPLFVLVLRELAVGWRAAAATAILFALSPFHARISASSSEHVLASTLTIAQLAAWLAGVRRRDPWLILLAMLLLPAAVLTRVDALIQVALIPLWSLARGRSSWRPYFLYALVAAATGVLAYVAIVRTSNHPSPELPMMAQALRDVFPQYLKLATQAPGWFPLCSVALTGLGVLVMLLKRPALLGCIVVSLLASFGLLGRSFLHDELVGARYFLFTIPMFLLPAGFAVDALAALTLDRLSRAWRLASTAVLLGAVGGVALIQALPAYRTSYAFQDEYLFARRALASLPDGCSVYELPIRNDQIEDDLDCCLDLPRSPLELAFPRLKFRALPTTAPEDVDLSQPCVAYYESVMCRVEDSPTLHDHWGKSIGYFHQRCGEVRSAGVFTPIEQATVSSRATNDFFRSAPPSVGLFHWSLGGSIGK